MPDPVMSSVAAAVAGKVAEAAIQGGQTACAALFRLVRERFGRGTAASAALEAARADPDDEGAVREVAVALERLAREDTAFDVRVRELWGQASAELSASEGGVINSATGSVGGHLMQAKEVHVQGGLHFGDVERPWR